MVALVVVLPVKEHKVADLGLIAAVGGLVQAAGLQRGNPLFTVGLAGEVLLGDFGVVQIEGHEHRAPLSIAGAIPLAVAGVALALAVVADDEVDRALLVAQLGLGHGDQILRPFAGQADAGGLFPDRLVFADANRAGDFTRAGRSIAKGIRDGHFRGNGGRLLAEVGGCDGDGLGELVQLGQNLTVLTDGDANGCGLDAAGIGEVKGDLLAGKAGQRIGADGGSQGLGGLDGHRAVGGGGAGLVRGGHGQRKRAGAVSQPGDAGGVGGQRAGGDLRTGFVGYNIGKFCCVGSVDGPGDGLTDEHLPGADSCDGHGGRRHRLGRFGRFGGGRSGRFGGGRSGRFGGGLGSGPVRGGGRFRGGRLGGRVLADAHHSRGLGGRSLNRLGHRDLLFLDRLGIALFRVHVLGLSANKDALVAVIPVGVLLALLEAAGEAVREAVGTMNVLVLTTDRIRGHGDDRLHQLCEHSGNHQHRQHADNSDHSSLPLFVRKHTRKHFLHALLHYLFRLSRYPANHFTAPMFSRGQTLKNIFPTISSTLMHPTTELRLSIDVVR